jgi:hypothetical protein
MNKSIKNPDNSQLVSEAILMDKQLMALYAKRAEIIMLATPTVVLKNDKSEIIWIDESNHPLLHGIEEMITQRIEHITNCFNNQ